ncbi:MAG TPA: class II aldolase/adducin family protein [Woeseiaceae bacterium]|nr:class II aldolase/adducin family protein [Woeseiaceae bacterium]
MPSHYVDEGYVKYTSDWRHGPAPAAAAVTLLDTWRQKLFDAGLVGYDETHEVGFGNVSIRALRAGEFIITGTQTGHLRETTGKHYCLVTSADIAGNRVTCEGPVQASSEALTHAAIYRLSERINAVAHVHDLTLWARHRDRLPTTAASVPYGTPGMAREFERLWRETDFPTSGLAVMAGHEGGLVCVGGTLAEACGRMLTLAALS